MDKISFPYRARDHLPLLHVIAESGSWERHGLDVHYNHKISSSEAHRAVPAGDVEFVGGNHVSTYAHRARGDSWVYLGQTLNSVSRSLVVRPDSEINGIGDLRGKKIGVRGTHPSLNDWLYMKQRGLDSDRDDIEFVNQVATTAGSMDYSEENIEGSLWEWVRDGHVDAAFQTAPLSLFAKEAGMKVIDIEAMPMIWFTTVSSSLTFVEKHPDIVDRFLKGIIEGIHFFKTQPDKAIEIIQRRFNNEGQLDRDKAAFTYRSLATTLEPQLLPSMTAIGNVYQEAIRQDKDALKINPLELWDLHHIRRIADSGFVKNLYANTPVR